MNFKKGQLDKESYKVIMHDLECLDLSGNPSNIYHYDLLKANLNDIFGYQYTICDSCGNVIDMQSPDAINTTCGFCGEEFA